jgi:hypothetical protein
VPDGFEDKVVKALSLTPTEANELQRAAAVSRSQYNLTLAKDAPPEDRALAHDLAESFARLSPAEKEKIRKLLKGTRNG